MKSLITTLALLAVTQNAMAGELVIGEGHSSGRKGTDANLLYDNAKSEVAARYPTSAFKQISGWNAWIATIGPETYVGVQASFVGINESEPHFITTSENRVWARNKDEIDELVELSKERAINKAKFFCHSDVTQILPWEVKVTPKDGYKNVSDIEVTARFQCKQ